MRLCIDWGNTRVKAAVFEEDKLLKEYNFSEEEALTQLVGILEEYKPKAAILSSVSNHPPELKVLLQEYTQLLVLNSQTFLPIMNAYHSPETLGADRLALAVGANSEFTDRDNLVISVGCGYSHHL
jgi:type III pantothenate kinase